MDNYTLFVWALFWISLYLFWYLRHRAEKKRIQRRRERYRRIALQKELNRIKE